MPALLARFGDRRPVLRPPPEPVVTFPAAHPEVGDLVIWDSGDEATVEIGSIAHGHFPGQSPCEAVWDQEASAAVIEFLDRVFADRILLWTHGRGRGGGWCDRAYERDTAHYREGARLFVWSGPLDAV